MKSFKKEVIRRKKKIFLHLFLKVKVQELLKEQ